MRCAGHLELTHFSTVTPNLQTSQGKMGQGCSVRCTLTLMCNDCLGVYCAALAEHALGAAVDSVAVADPVMAATRALFVPAPGIVDGVGHSSGGALIHDIRLCNTS